MKDLRPLLILRLFWQSLRVQPRRAVLTIAAIAWGTVTILLLLAFGEGLKRQMVKNTLAMGENLAVIWPAETTKSWKGLPPGRPIRVSVDDVPWLRERLTRSRTVIGEMVSWRTALAYGTKTVNAQVVGSNWEYGQVRKHFARPGGRFFGPIDERDKRRVVFLGDELARDIFGAEEPVGKSLLVNGSPFLVIGVMRHKTMSGNYGGPDRAHAVIPISTFGALLGRATLENLVLQARDRGEMAAALAELRETLSGKLGFDPQDERALPTWDTVRSSTMTYNILLGLEIFLGVIGGITLLTGGVGVANIMFAVVRERTREIGVKMALGARGGWITAPFVLEGLLYTLVGGAVGMLISATVVGLLSLLPLEGNQVLEFLGRPTLSPGIGMATAAILGTMGMLAGYFPARRAAAVDPASTLRYE